MKVTKNMQYIKINQSEFIYKYIVTSSDIDLFKHMSYANYLKLLFTSSDTLLLPIFTNDFMESGRLIANFTRLQFKYQSQLGDSILMKLTAANLSENSFDIIYSFFLESSGVSIASGLQTFVFQSIDGHTPKKYPPNINKLLNGIEVQHESKAAMIYPSEKANGRNHDTFLYDKLTAFFKHTDMHGYVHVYNYLEWMSYAREAFFNKIFPNRLAADISGFSIVTFNTEYRHLSDARFGDSIEIIIYTENVRRSSFDVIFEFQSPNKIGLLGVGRQTLVFLDSKTNKPTMIPEKLIIELKKGEKKLSPVIIGK